MFIERQVEKILLAPEEQNFRIFIASGKHCAPLQAREVSPWDHKCVYKAFGSLLGASVHELPRS